jgi:hypothetical protein
MAETPIRLKLCTRCKVTKPVHEYGRNSQAADGLHYYCKTCAAIKQRLWAEHNGEKMKQVRKRYRDKLATQAKNRDPYKP